MSKFKEYVNKLVTKADAKSMIGLMDVLEEHFEEMKLTDPGEYWEVVNDLHVLLYGNYFDEGCALYAVSQMQNEDGTTGQHWSKEETTAAAINAGIPFTKFNEYDWYYVMNMVYSDYFSLLGSSVPNYVQFSKAWIMDKDAPVGKAYLYYKMISENK